MKRLWILLAAGLLLAAANDFTIIRFGGGLTVRRFQDGQNTCYVATSDYGPGASPSIACVRLTP